MKATAALLCIAPVLLAGCANRPDPPLLFGASHVFGVSIGGSGAEASGEFVVGYKGTNIAVIPVSAMENGSERGVGATYDGAYPDSYSVLGQFGGDATRSNSEVNAGLGKFFATGTAAVKLAGGYARKMGHKRSTTAGCDFDTTRTTSAGTQPTPVAEDRTARLTRKMAAAPAAGTQPTSSTTGSAMLMFAQYDYKALAIDASAVDSGAKLTLGFKDRNIAIVPVVGRDSNGNLVPLGSGTQGEGHQDAYSVLGQFESKDGQAGGTTTSFLNSFFSTGAAADRLSDGFRVKLCEEYKAASAK